MMKQLHKSSHASGRDNAGLRLLAVALALAAIAIAADLTWMLPHAGPLYDVDHPRQAAAPTAAADAVDDSAQSTYGASQLKPQASKAEPQP
jgi:hypothetical protein